MNPQLVEITRRNLQSFSLNDSRDEMAATYLTVMYHLSPEDADCVVEEAKKPVQSKPASVSTVAGAAAALAQHVPTQTTPIAEIPAGITARFPMPRVPVNSEPGEIIDAEPDEPEDEETDSSAIMIASGWDVRLFGPINKESTFFQSIALPLAKRGLKVGPVNGKVPVLDEHQKEATINPAKIIETWKPYGNLNAGVWCIQEGGGVLVVDSDKFGPVGLLKLYTEETGKTIDTYMVQSSPAINGKPERGHIYFWQTPQTRSLPKNIVEGDTDGEFSLRVRNYMILGEGSIHPVHHGRYTAISGPTIIPMPNDFLAWLIGRANKYSKTGDFTKKPEGWINEPIIHGDINNRLTKIAGYYIQNKNIDDAEILYTILAKHAENQAVDKDGVTPFSCNQEEIRQIAVGAVGRWKTGEERHKQENLELNQTPILPDEPRIEQYAMTPEEIDAEMEKDFPVIPLVEQVGPLWDDDVMYGICGDIVRKASQYCESHPAGMYLDLIVALGNIIGRGPYFNITSTKHFTNEFMCRVGLTSESRKGTGRDVIDELLRLVDYEWYTRRVMSGFGSAEAIVNELRDPLAQKLLDKKAFTGFREVVAPGVDDKRLCIREGELASVFQLAGKNESRADIVLRDGWDGKTLRNLVKGKSRDGLSNSNVCQEPHLSISGDTTRSELIAKMPEGADANGFGNRFLYCFTYRTKKCPNGGPQLDWSKEILQLYKSIEQARKLAYVPLSKAASKAWGRMYLELDEPGNKLPGLAGAMTARAAAHIRRLALIFALLDESEIVETRHLQAGKRLWDYCQESARYIFTGTTKEQDQIRRFIERNGPATIPQIRRDLFHAHKKTDWVREQVKQLTVQAGSRITFSEDKVIMK